MRIGEVALDTEGIGVRIRSGAGVLPGIPAEVCLPASALRNLHVVIDGPAREMTVALSGVLKPKGEHIGCWVNPDTGLVLIDTTIDGEGACRYICSFRLGRQFDLHGGSTHGDSEIKSLI
jgi:hypothetical protein